MEAHKAVDENNIIPLLEDYFKCYPDLKEKWIQNCKEKFNSPTQSRLFDHFPLLCWPDTFAKFNNEFESILELFLTDPIDSQKISIAINTWFKKIGALGYNILFDEKTKKIKPAIIFVLKLEPYQDKLEKKLVLQNICMAYISVFYQFILGAYKLSILPKQDSPPTSMTSSFYNYVQTFVTTSPKKCCADLTFDQHAMAMKQFSIYISTHLWEIAKELVPDTLNTTAMINQTLAASEKEAMPIIPVNNAVISNEQEIPITAANKNNIQPTSTASQSSGIYHAISNVVTSPYYLTVNTLFYAASWLPTFKNAEPPAENTNKKLQLSDLPY